jgi:hypothetical protein
MIDNAIRAATCHLTCGNEQGTGFLIDKDKVLTARHCVINAIEKGAGVELTFPDGNDETTLSAKVLNHSTDLDACILFIEGSLDRKPIPVGSVMPREGIEWRSFAYPEGKTLIGHRLSGTISHTLPKPKAIIDVDLAIDTNNQLQSYRGCSGAAVVCGTVSRGMIRLKVDGTLGAISVTSLKEFLATNGITTIDDSENKDSSSNSRLRLAERDEFQKLFEAHLLRNPSTYLFLEGAHGMGKTTFSNEFSPLNGELLLLGTYSILPSQSGLSAIYRSQPEVFFDWLSTTVSSLIYGKSSRNEERSYPTLVTETSEFLAAFSKYCGSVKRHGLIFIDGINEVQDSEPAALPKFLGLLPRILPNNISVVLTAPNYTKLSAYLSDRIKKENLFLLPPLTDGVCVEYCWGELDEKTANASLVENICAKAQGHPLYLRYLINYAKSHPEDNDLNDFPVLDGPIEQYYETIWSKLFSDADGIQLLATIARLRFGIIAEDFLKALSDTERSTYLPTISRIQHLLASGEYLVIYHSSFTAFVLNKTQELEVHIQRKLGEFCEVEKAIRYCRLNIVYHFLKATDESRLKSVKICDQRWVDSCVTLGAEPDTLITDVQACLEAAAEAANPVEVVRLLLLSQRVTFRYNNLLAQSAHLMAEALIALKRPREALNHAIRYQTLIVDPQEALSIAFSLIDYGYFEEALQVLKLIERKCTEAYSGGLSVEDFVQICKAHIQSILLRRLAGGSGEMNHVFSVLEFSKESLKTVLADEPTEVFQACLDRISSTSTSYFICFRDVYSPIAFLRKARGVVPPSYVNVLLAALFDHHEWTSHFNLPKDRESMPLLLSDIHELFVSGARIESSSIPSVINLLIKYGGSSSLVSLITGDQIQPQLSPAFNILKPNAVDVDFHNVFQFAMAWRIRGYLDLDRNCPLVPVLGQEKWLVSIEQLISALFFCEGRSRRAKSDSNESLQAITSATFLQIVLPALEFTLASRVVWSQSYAIPEALIPFIYDHLSLLLVECFPEHLPRFIQSVVDRSSDQLGLYSEGYCACMWSVINNFTRGDVDASLSQRTFELLENYRDHVVDGVENRYELVPSLLQLIIFYVRIGAEERAAELFQRMLGVSMGPSWYKEDQLGLMMQAIEKLKNPSELQPNLPMIAGYLERASGEMTFQRYIRHEKAVFVGELFNKNLVHQGCRYFKSQSSGGIEQLVSEWESGHSDKPSPRVGMRYPGGALEEQATILYMIQNAAYVHWRLRWALLEIFYFGDERHIDDYATEYAKIVNEVAKTPGVVDELVERINLLLICETPPKKRGTFARAFTEQLDVEHRATFSNTSAFPTIPDDDIDLEIKSNSSTETSNVSAGDKESEEEIFFPGVFGNKASTREAASALESGLTKLSIGNRKAAMRELTRMLQILQEGSWSVWEKLGAVRADKLFDGLSMTASEIVQTYGPLINTERHAPSWRVAEHLIAKFGGLLNEDDRRLLLECVIEHIALMVGDATKEFAKFEFLKEKIPDQNSAEIFSFIIWLIDHPKWLRREKAASILIWLVEAELSFLQQLTKNAFLMTDGLAADVLCGVLDCVSRKDPLKMWNSIFPVLEVESILTSCKHLSRITTLHNLAERAKHAGATSGREIANRIQSVVRTGAVKIDSSASVVELPAWAECVKPEWKELERFGIANQALIKEVEKKLEEICKPLSLHDTYDLENAVSLSFREALKRPLNRWEAKIRFALNCTLLPYASEQNFRDIQSVLSVYNSHFPEQTLNPSFISPSYAILDFLFKRKDSCAAVIGDAENYILDIQLAVELSGEDKLVHVRVVAIIVPSSLHKRGFFSPSLTSKIRPSHIPQIESLVGQHETSFCLEPMIAFFGKITPAFPLPHFIELINAQKSDFQRFIWRDGRTNNVRFPGRPIEEGGLLAVRKGAVKLPEDKKLAWIILIEDEVAAIVDEENHYLY